MPYPKTPEGRAKHNAASKRYRDRTKEEQAAYHREYYKRRKAHILARTKRWRQANQAKVNAKAVETRKKNPEKYNAYQREWRKRNAGKRKEQDRVYAMKRKLAKFGCTLEQRDEMLTAQGNRCALCDGQFSKTDYAVVDHCHTRNKARAVLHNKCNLALGLMNDDPVKANRLFEYLMRHQ